MNAFRFTTRFVITLLIVCVCSARIEACGVLHPMKTLKPGSWVEVADTGYDATIPGNLLWAFFDFGEASALVPAFANGNTNFEFVVPPTLFRPWEEKPILSLWLTNGETACEITGLTHGALTKTGNNFSHLIGLVGENYAAIATDMGFSEEDRINAAIAPSSTQLNPVLTYASSAIYVVPFIRDLFVQANSSEDASLALQVMNSFIESTNVISYLEKKDTLNQEIIKKFSPTKSAFNSNSNIILASQTSINPLYHNSIAGEITRPPETNWIEPKTAEELSLQMRKQLSASIANSSIKTSGKNRITSFKTSTLRDTVGTVLGLGSLLASTTKTPVGKSVSVGYTMAAHFLFMQAFSDKLVDGLYPNKFESINTYNGPWKLSSTQAPRRATINKILVKTSAKGLNMAQLMADLVNNFFPYGALGGKAVKMAGKAANQASSIALKRVGPGLSSRFATLSQRITKNQKESASNAVSAVETVGKQILSTHLGDAKFDGPLSAFKIPKFDLAPINILEPGFYQTRLDTNEHLMFSFSETKPRLLYYDAIRSGNTILTYEVKPGLWGKNHISNTQLIQVDPDSIWVTPETQTILPGDQFAITVEYVLEGSKGDDIDVDFMSSSGFKVIDFSEPLFTENNGTATISWVVDIQSPSNKNLFPGEIKVKRISNPNEQATARVERAKITPTPICVDTSTATQFLMLDEVGRPFEVIWTSEPLGFISKSGLFDARNKNGTTTITAETSDGSLADSIQVTIGCSCFWSANLDGAKDEGEILTSGQLAVGPVVNYMVNFIDANKLVPAITGQGDLITPETLSVTFQKGDQSYQSGLPVNTNILSTIKPKSQCRVPKNTKLDWSVYNKRWLRASLVGEAATIEEYGTACVENTVPFSLNFMLALKEEQINANSNQAESLLNGLFSGLNTESGCIRADSD